jgi:exopolysaccharide biosynthesis WecB/TagA/CpsF family protein
LNLKPCADGNVIILCPGGLEHGGGIGRQMGYFLRARQLQTNGPRYRVIDTRGPWFLGASPLRIGFAAVYLASAALKLVRARRSSRCAVHVNITGRGSTIRKVILLTLTRGLGLPYLLHVHDYNYADEYRSRGRLIRALIATIFRRAVKILVLGSRDRDVLSSLLGLPQHRFVVLPNAVPDPLEDGTRVSRPERSCHFLFLGHLNARKGVPELLQALARPAPMSRRWRATLAGGGSIDEYRRLADTLGIADRVDFPGWVDESQVRSLCADADALVLPSHAEGLAMAVLEGLSHGLVVVTTPVGAHPEVIEPEVSGLLVPPGDVEALADALVRVIDDEHLRRLLGAQARRCFLEKFDVRAYAEQLSRLHAGLLPDPRDVAANGDKQTAQTLAPIGRTLPQTVSPGSSERVNILGVGVTPFDLAQAVATLDRWREEGRREYVCCVSVHGLVTAQRDREIRYALNRSGLATEDGMPLVWWCRRAGFARAGRVCGSDLLDAMCALAVRRGHRHYFYGGSPHVVEQLVSRLTQRHPGLVIAGYRSPPFRPLTEAEDAADVAAINAARPDFVWIGLGMPKQEKWMVSHVARVDAAALIGVGAAFDFHAGTKPRAPQWMQHSGFEWLFRLISEPRRLAGRYLIDNTIFVAHAARQLTGLKSYARDW